MVSGCINPAEQVPIVNVNITFIEKEGIAEAENYTLTQGTVSFLSRPRRIQSESLPSISARTMIVEGKNITVGPWENVPYKGAGIYSFNIGFDEKHYPVSNDTVRVSIMLWDINRNTGKGERIGSVVGNIIWN